MFEVSIEKDLDTTIIKRFDRLCDALSCGMAFAVCGAFVDVTSMETGEILMSVSAYEVYFAECVKMAD